MKILEYIIRFKNEAKAGADAAAKVAQDLGKKTADVLRGSSMAVGGEIKGFFARLRGEVGAMLGNVPGLGKMKDAFTGSAAALAGGAIAMGSGIKSLLDSISAQYRQLSDEIEQTSIKMAAKQAQIINKQRGATTAQSQVGLQNDLIGEIAQLKQQIAAGRSGIDARGAVEYATGFYSGTNAMEEAKIAAMEQEVFALERQLALSKKKEGRLAAEEADANVKAAPAALSGVLAAAASKAAFEAMSDADKRKELQGRVEQSKSELRQITDQANQGRLPWTEELAKRVDVLLAAFDEASRGLADIDKRTKDETDKAAKAKSDAEMKSAEQFKDLRSKLREERIGQLSPEKQLAARQAEYRAVATEGRNTSDPEKKIELANRAMELRAIMRPMIEAANEQKQAAQAAREARREKYAAGVGIEGGDDDDEPMRSGRRQRVVGLGRLGGNRMPSRFRSRFGRFESSASQFLGSEPVGGSAPGKRSVEDLQEEANKLLREIRDRTGFGKGG